MSILNQESRKIQSSEVKHLLLPHLKIQSVEFLRLFAMAHRHSNKIWAVGIDPCTILLEVLAKFIGVVITRDKYVLRLLE